MTDKDIEKLKGKLNQLNVSIRRQTRIQQDILEENSNLRAEQKKLKNENKRLDKLVEKHLDETQKVIQNKSQILNKVGLLSMEDRSLDTREYKLLEKEKAVEAKKLEVDKQIQILAEQKDKAIAIREAQTSSYYKPTAVEEEFFTTGREGFLAYYEEYGNIAKSAKAAGIRPSLIAFYKKKFPDFAGDMQIAYEMFKDRLDGELIDRAINGQEKASFYKGEVVDHYTEKNDGLLLAAAKAHVPEKYDRGKLDRIEGSTSNNVVVNMVSYSGVNPSDFGAVENVGVVSFVGEHGDMKRITNDRMKQHELAVDPDETIIDVEMEEKQSQSVVFTDEDD